MCWIVVSVTLGKQHEMGTTWNHRQPDSHWGWTNDKSIRKLLLWLVESCKYSWSFHCIFIGTLTGNCYYLPYEVLLVFLDYKRTYHWSKLNPILQQTDSPSWNYEIWNRDFISKLTWTRTRHHINIYSSPLITPPNYYVKFSKLTQESSNYITLGLIITRNGHNTTYEAEIRIN